CARPRFAYW
nr:immunoglobulin heavy chain junction region [Mus musculus]